MQQCPEAALNATIKYRAAADRNLYGLAEVEHVRRKQQDDAVTPLVTVSTTLPLRIDSTRPEGFDWPKSLLILIADDLHTRRAAVHC